MSYALSQQSHSPNKHRAYWQSACHTHPARLYTTYRQSCWEPNKEGTSKKLVTVVYSLEFVTLPSQTTGQQIPLLKALKVKS